MSRVFRGACAPLLLMVAVGCGSDDASTADKRIVPAATTAAPGGTKPTGAAKSVDCPALKQATGSLIVNWQVVVGLSRSTDVAQWKDTTAAVGTMSQFAGQLDELDAQLGGDKGAAESIAFMKGANEIVQRGIGGDASALQALKDYLGTDITAIIMKQVPIATAADNAGC